MTLNIYTAYRHGLIGRETYVQMHAERNAGDRIEDLPESVQDAVREVIRVAGEHGRCARNFPDLDVEAYAHRHPSGRMAWGLNSMVTGINTKQGIRGMIKDRDVIVEQMNAIAENLREAADRTEVRAKYFARDGHTDTVLSLLNELMWLTPNLGIQAMIAKLVRELESSND